MSYKIMCDWHTHKTMVIVTVPLPTLVSPIGKIVADRNHNVFPTEEGVKDMLHSYIDKLKIEFKREDMMLEFKPEDFIAVSTGAKGVLAAQLANAKFQEWVSQCEVVYMDTTNHWHKENTEQIMKARIFDIRPIETEHESAQYTGGGEYVCIECNKKLKPKGWEVVDE
jgi:3'-phosphoadenosine 5'-phosphosulfate sulfotransferase (PAPS reductase)/FAD synthetase